MLGFSRGAYTARSLVGMIRNVGLLTPDNIHRIDDAYGLYRNRDFSADTEEAQAFRSRYSRNISIKFLGVWDTVGALGIPLAALEWLNAAVYAFHDTELSGIVKNAAHAVAIDENRVDYQVTLWKQIAKVGQSVEQCWFIGAHADVGGGYDSRDLSDITLNWMQAKARAAGLSIDPKKIATVTNANWQGAVTDSMLSSWMASMPRRILLTIARSILRRITKRWTQKCWIDADVIPAIALKIPASPLYRRPPQSCDRAEMELGSGPINFLRLM